MTPQSNYKSTQEKGKDPSTKRLPKWSQRIYYNKSQKGPARSASSEVKKSIRCSHSDYYWEIVTPETSNNTDKPREHAGSKKPVTVEYIPRNSIHMKLWNRRNRIISCENDGKGAWRALQWPQGYIVTEATVTQMLTAGKTLPTIPSTRVDPKVYKLHFSKADSVPPKNGLTSVENNRATVIKTWNMHNLEPSALPLESCHAVQSSVRMLPPEGKHSTHTDSWFIAWRHRSRYKEYSTQQQPENLEQRAVHFCKEPRG